jgi:hypothetical protein
VPATSDRDRSVIQSSGPNNLLDIFHGVRLQDLEYSSGIQLRMDVIYENRLVLRYQFSQSAGSRHRGGSGNELASRYHQVFSKGASYQPLK